MIEASTPSQSVALLDGPSVRAWRAVAGGGGSSAGRSEPLMPAIADCLAEAGVGAAALTGVACGEGPGGFTGLRTAAALAKGLGYSLGIPLYAVSSLLLTALAARRRVAAESYLAATDALRGEHYALRFAADAAGVLRGEGEVALVGSSDLPRLAARYSAVLCGIGLPVDVVPSACDVSLALPMILAQGPVDLASWEPRYGRLAEAQVKWEAAHGVALSGSGGSPGG